MGNPGLSRQARKVHQIGPPAIETGPCREHDATAMAAVQSRCPEHRRSFAPVRAMIGRERAPMPIRAELLNRL